MRLNKNTRRDLKNIMMNRKIDHSTKTSTSSVFDYELSKLNNKRFSLFIMAITIQLLSFSFFVLVGKFDTGEDTISSFKGIIALSNTVTMCVYVIIGSVMLRKDLVRFYIGEQRNRLFLFPVDRKNLFIKNFFCSSNYTQQFCNGYYNSSFY